MDPGCGLTQSAEAFAWQEAPGKYQRHLLLLMHTIPTGPTHVESGPSPFHLPLSSLLSRAAPLKGCGGFPSLVSLPAPIC